MVVKLLKQSCVKRAIPQLVPLMESLFFFECSKSWFKSSIERSVTIVALKNRHQE